MNEVCIHPTRTDLQPARAIETTRNAWKILSTSKPAYEDARTNVGLPAQASPPVAIAPLQRLFAGSASLAFYAASIFSLLYAGSLRRLNTC